MTYDEYFALPDDGKRYEVIEGELCLLPTPWLIHQAVSRNLSVSLGNVVLPRHLGQVLFAPLDVVLTDTNVVQPDILYVSNDRRHILTEACVRGAPDLVIEITSDVTRERDEVTKLRLYERYGVGEYWLLDPDVATVRIYRRAGNEFVGEFSADPLTTPLLPDLAIPLATIFED